MVTQRIVDSIQFSSAGAILHSLLTLLFTVFNCRCLRFHLSLRPPITVIVPTVAPKSRSQKGPATTKTPIVPEAVPLPPSVPPSPTKSTSSSSSDSDSDFLNAYIQHKHAYTEPLMASLTATVEHPVTKHCPIVTGGDLTPQTVLILENVFNEFFIAKNVSKEDEVKLILGAFKDVHVRDWIATDRVRLLGLKFEEFMAEL